MSNDPATVETLESRRLLSADLAAAFSGAFPTEINPADQCRLRVRVSNHGPDAAQPVTVNVYASAHGTLDGGDRLLGTTTRGKPINSGRAASFKVSLALPADLAEGQYHLLAEVVDGSGAADMNPADNVAVGRALVALQQPFTDLGIAVTGQPRGALSTVGRNGGEGPLATVRVDVFNAGNTIADGSVGVGLYLSTSGLLDASAIPIATDEQSVHLKPDAAKCVKLKFRLPSTVAAGDYTLLAALSSDASLADENFANDLAKAPVAVTVVSTPLARPSRIFCFPHHYDFGGGDDGIDYEDVPVIDEGGEIWTWEEITPSDPAPTSPPDFDPGTQPTPDPSTQPTPDDWGGNDDTGGIDYTGGETDTGWSGDGSDFGWSDDEW